MTHSRDASAPEFCLERNESLPPKRGSGAPTGAPPWPCLRSTAARLAIGALASRRSTAALATQINAMAQPRPCFLGRAKRGHYPRPLSQSSEAPRRPVVMPADPMPGPPENGVTSPARRNRTRPISGCRRRRPLVSETKRYVTYMVTNVKDSSLRKRPNQCGMTKRYVTARNTGSSTAIDHTM
jgi:hypothetical protein